MSCDSQSGKRPWGRYAMGLFVMLTCARVWMGPVTIVEPASAQIPDSGLQRQLLLDEARRTNGLLADIKQTLLTHPLNVRIRSADITGTDNKAGAAAKSRGVGR